MKRYNILLSFLLVVLASCTNDRFDFGGNNASVRDGLHIIGAVEDFDIKNVGTRADGEEIADSYISEMTMFVFKPNGDLIQGYSNRTVVTQDDDEVPTKVTFDDADKCTSAINIQKGNPTFLIDTKKGYFASLDGNDERMIYYDNGTGNTNATGLDQCSIYIVANAWHQLEGKLNDIKKLDDLKAVVLDIDNTLDMPKNADGQYRGFPMIGTHIAQVTFDLSKGGSNAHSVATIPLKKLFSKVRFTIQVNADQTVSGQIPKFQIEKAEVFNVPAKAKLGRELDANGKPVYGDGSDYITELAGGSLSSENVSTYYQYPFGNGVGATPFVITDFKDGKTTVRHNESDDQTSDIIEFSFYVPEHKVTPNAITYPENLPTNLKQYYKPKGVGVVRNGDGTTNASKIATFVRIHGVYTDHNGQIKDVRYDIYLGQNNYDDFTIKRNQLLNNKLIIMGLTNYHDAYGDVEGNISIDHRVDVDNKGFNLSMERTAVLDSHFEVRPLDIELAPGSSMTVKIPEEYQNWIAMESDAEARLTKDGNTYVNTSTPRKGVRKYFTTNLVSELNEDNHGEITVTHSGADKQATEIHRLWFYVDENVNVYDKLLKSEYGDNRLTESPTDGSYTVDTLLYRNGKVQFYHAASGYPDLTASPNVSINFQQWNLWRVWNSSRTRYYDIECEEEYLNNYASDQIYGQTQNGMAWGLNGVQLSNNIIAYWKDETTNNIWAAIIDWIFDTNGAANSIFAKSGVAPLYDFYLSGDAFPVNKLDAGYNPDNYKRDYQGLAFNKEIATTLLKKYSDNDSAKINGVILTEDPVSAFAYCYNKNKRDEKGNVCTVSNDGSVNTDNLKWYLPAIDEIEEIALGAYDEFDEVFQNQKYWSCQPTYDYNTLHLSARNWVVLTYVNLGVSLDGEYYNDDLNRARATSVYATGPNTYTTVKSGLPTGVKSGHLEVMAYSGGNRDGDADLTHTKTSVDYSTEIFTSGEYSGNKSRSDKCRIRAVYRSGTK